MKGYRKSHHKIEKGIRNMPTLEQKVIHNPSYVFVLPKNVALFVMNSLES